MRDLVQRYYEVKVPKLDARLFELHLIQDPNAWFVEFPDQGLVFFTDVNPRHGATMHVVFWDTYITNDRRRRIRDILRTAFQQFSLPRVTCFVREGSSEAFIRMLRRIGFVLEGTIRKGWIEETRHLDCIMFGLLPEDLKDGDDRSK